MRSVFICKSSYSNQIVAIIHVWFSREPNLMAPYQGRAEFQFPKSKISNSAPRPWPLLFREFVWKRVELMILKKVLW